MHIRILAAACAVAAITSLSGQAAAAEEPAKPAPKTEKHHIVKTGESLSTIAAEYKLESWRPLWNVNPELSDPDTILPDQKLIIPQDPTTDRPLPAVAVVPQAPVRSAYQPAATKRRASAANYAGGTGGVFERIRQLESGGNYATNTGNGYYGAYQFDLGTWRGVGGTGLPSDASPAEQDARAAALYAKRGCSPWPNTCR